MEFITRACCQPEIPQNSELTAHEVKFKHLKI